MTEPAVKRGRGRPPSSTDLKTVRAFRSLAGSGIQPLEVMVFNMRKAWQKALDTEALRLKEGRDMTADGTDLEKLEWEFRREAHTFAVAAAPYMHSKLASVELTGLNGGPVEVATTERPKMSRAEWLAAHGIGNDSVTDAIPK